MHNTNYNRLPKILLLCEKRASQIREGIAEAMWRCKRCFAYATATKIVLDNDPDLYRDRRLQECLANRPIRGQAMP
jgi:hypothetical protein